MASIKLVPTNDELQLSFADFTTIHPEVSRMTYSRYRAKAGIKGKATRSLPKAAVAPAKALEEPQSLGKLPGRVLEASESIVEAPTSSSEDLNIEDLLGLDEEKEKNEKDREKVVTNENVTENIVAEKCNKSGLVNELNEPISTLKSVPEKGVEEDVRDVTIDVTNANVTSPKPLTKAQLKWQGLMIHEVLQTGGEIRATQSLGLDYATYMNWTNPESLHYSREFHEPIKNALELFKKGDKEACLQAIEKHRDRYWQAAAWLLERQYPAEFAKREGISIGSLGINLGLAITTKPGLATVNVAQAKFEVLPDQDPTADSN